jgi:prepilin-type N-terminal cleavage/methylation domain-containing protein
MMAARTERARQARRAVHAFTLVELLVVILILTALMVIAIPRYFEAVYRAKVRACQANIQIVNTATQAFFARNKVWPALVADMCETTAPSWVIAPPIQEDPLCPFGVPYEFRPVLQDGTVGGSPAPGNPQVGVELNVADHFDGPWKTAQGHK